jgi:hypothetical protein
LFKPITLLGVESGNATTDAASDEYVSSTDDWRIPDQ